MTAALDLLRKERRARVFFAVLTQSSLGTGAAYVALLVVAYERFHSPWAISLVLLADFLPPMFLGPLLGAAVDRWPRRACAVAGDVVRAVAFVGIGLVDGFPATIALALLAGAGTALFRPAALAALPSLVAEERSSAATSLYSAIADLGFTAGPALAALLLIAISPEWLLVANGATFAVSAVILARIPFGAAASRSAEAEEGALSLLREAREGARAVFGMRAIAVLLGVSGAAMLSGGVFNVVELPFASDELGAGAAGYSLLVSAYGLGFVAGSLSGSGGGTPGSLRRRYVAGLILTGAGGLALGMAPSLVPAMFGFTIGGFGNGLFVAHQRLLIQAEVPAELHGRTFAMADTLASWGFVIALAPGGALLTLASSRELMYFTGAWELTLALVAALTLRRHWVAGQRERGEEVGLGSLRGGDIPRAAYPRE
jgi:MFS family permease